MSVERARMEPVLIHEADVAMLERVGPLWTALYEHQSAHGMLVQVPPNGFQLWRDGLRSLLGRFAVVWVAERGGAVVGFLCGRVRVLPSYFGGGNVGFVSDVYVSPECRGGGIGRRLLGTAIEWYEGRGIRRVELQVIAGNPGARELYLDMGWKDELVQMVRVAGG